MCSRSLPSAGEGLGAGNRRPVALAAWAGGESRGGGPRWSEAGDARADAEGGWALCVTEGT